MKCTKGNYRKAQIIKAILMPGLNTKEHPTKTLQKAIELTYGHKVDFIKLVELIETSKVVK